MIHGTEVERNGLSNAQILPDSYLDSALPSEGDRTAQRSAERSGDYCLQPPLL